MRKGQGERREKQTPLVQTGLLRREKLQLRYEKEQGMEKGGNWRNDHDFDINISQDPMSDVILQVSL